VLASHLIRPLDFAAFVEDLLRKGKWTFAECSRRGYVGRIIRHIVDPLCPCKEDVPGQEADQGPSADALLLHSAAFGDLSCR
jgi:hypothetical protein